VLFYVVLVCKCVLPPGDNPIAVNKYYYYYKFKKTSVIVNNVLNCVPFFYYYYYNFILSFPKICNISTRLG